jgi:hypothetical protein
MSSILCKGLGTAGMGVALYDATQVGNQYARIGGEETAAKYIESAYFNSRSTDTVSFSDNALRQKTFDIRSKNPLPALWGKIKGGLQGFFYSLGTNLPIVACSALAIVGKGKLAKISAGGAVACAAYKLLRNGYGLGKTNPMD